MYHAAVRQKTKRVYEALSRGAYEPIVASFSDDATFQFLGNHPLGGKLRDRESIRKWFERYLGLFPDLHIEPHAIVVGGGPWDTVVATRFLASATLPSGRRYLNNGMQFIRLRWGRIVEDYLYEDTQALSVALDELAAAGRPEASAAPLGSAD